MKQTGLISPFLLVSAFLAVYGVFPASADSGYDYARIKSFNAFPAGGPLVPAGGLIEARDGALYGTTTAGGAFGLGTVFVLNKDGIGCRVLHSFGDTLHFGLDEGTSPKAALVEGNDGILYGTTGGGGWFRYGTIFAINKDGSNYRLLHTFSGNYDDGINPVAALIEGSDGRALWHYRLRRAGQSRHHLRNQ